MRTILLFLASLIVVVFLLWVKAVEIKRGRRIISGHYRNNLDDLVSNFLVLMKKYAVLMFMALAYWSYKAMMNTSYKMRKVAEKIAIQYHKAADVARGKQTLRKRGSVSYFLRHIGENREEMR